MTDQTDHDHNAIRRYRVIAMSHDQCVNTHGVEAIEDRAGALVYFGDHDAIASRLRAERDEAKRRAEEAEGELSDIDDALTDESDDTRVVAVRRLVREHADAVRERRNGEYDLRRIKEAETERDAAATNANHLRAQLADLTNAAQQIKADNERLREIIAAIRIHDPFLPASLWKKVLAVVDERNAAMSIDQETGQ